jgi:hypothetical protein
MQRGKNRWSLLFHGYQGGYTGGKGAGWLEIIWYTPAFGYADDANILEGSVHVVKENTESLLVVSKVTGLEVNADKNTWSFLESRMQNEVTL